MALSLCIAKIAWISKKSILWSHDFETFQWKSGQCGDETKNKYFAPYLTVQLIKNDFVCSQQNFDKKSNAIDDLRLFAHRSLLGAEPISFTLGKVDMAKFLYGYCDFCGFLWQKLRGFTHTQFPLTTLTEKLF